MLIPLFLFLIMTGDISVYALLFISLLIHEAGHLIAAYATRMRVRSCIIMPYGGELVISNRQLEPRRNRLIVALGGPLATVFLLGFALWIPFPGDDQVVRIQLVLLALNLLPILPLDGGQAICALLETDGSEYRTRALLLVYSMLVLFAAILLLFCGFPHTSLYIVLAIFLLIQNISAFRFRKYEKAYTEIKLNRLT